ncbi:MAG: hypothetical protein AAB892_00090 [Patescibacteria group bacterium]
MCQLLFDAIVQAKPREKDYLLTVVFTKDGSDRVTPGLFEQFQTACCGESVTLVDGEHGKTITGYTCAFDDPLFISMWGIAKLTQETFGVDTDVHFPG